MTKIIDLIIPKEQAEIIEKHIDNNDSNSGVLTLAHPNNPAADDMFSLDIEHPEYAQFTEKMTQAHSLWSGGIFDTGAQALESLRDQMQRVADDKVAFKNELDEVSKEGVLAAFDNVGLGLDKDIADTKKLIIDFNLTEEEKVPSNYPPQTEAGTSAETTPKPDLTANQDVVELKTSDIKTTVENLFNTTIIPAMTEAFDKNPNVFGKMGVRLHIEPDGSVSTAEVMSYSSSSEAAKEIEATIRAHFESLDFPESDTGKVTDFSFIVN
jgi:hypothetical protein